MLICLSFEPPEIILGKYVLNFSALPYANSKHDNMIKIAEMNGAGEFKMDDWLFILVVEESRTITLLKKKKSNKIITF
jgi:hypothetical protein